jgi:hypothetical protein
MFFGENEFPLVLNPYVHLEKATKVLQSNQQPFTDVTR